MFRSESLVVLCIVVVSLLSACSKTPYEQALKQAEKGKPEAQFTLANMYYNGSGVAMDNSEAERWMLTAAEQGYAPAQAELAGAYMYGVFDGYAPGPEDYTEALKWASLAAEQGNALGQVGMGHLFYNGWGVGQDYTEAVKWWNLAAQQGNALAQLELGAMYEHGIGVDTNYSEALKFYLLAAEGGNARAQALAGAIYASSRGGYNYSEAIKWYEQAADQGVAVAQLGLGEIYRDGNGVTRDYAEALRWLRLAAEQEVSAAQFAIGEFYENGWGVPADFSESKQWYELAAAEGNDDARAALEGLAEEAERRRLFLVGKCYRGDNIDDTSPDSGCGWNAIRRSKTGGMITIFYRSDQRILVGDGANMPARFRQERTIDTPVEYVLSESMGSSWSVDVIASPVDEPACKVITRYVIREDDVRSLAMPLEGSCSSYVRSINSRERSNQGLGKLITLRSL